MVARSRGNCVLAVGARVSCMVKGMSVCMYVLGVWVMFCVWELLVTENQSECEIDC